VTVLLEILVVPEHWEWIVYAQKICQNANVPKIGICQKIGASRE